jgi:hypothetical protein
VFLRPDPSRADLGGYSFRTRAVTLADELWITITVEAHSGRGESDSVSGETVFTVIVDGSESITELLPVPEGPPRYVRVQRNVSGADPPESVTVLIELGEQVRTLTARVFDER